MKIVIDILDKDANFVLKMLQNLSFVKHVKPLTASAAKLFSDLTEAAEQVKLHKSGKLKLKTAQELLDEL